MLASPQVSRVLNTQIECTSFQKLCIGLSNFRDGATCITCHCAFASLQARLENPSQTCFHVKQAARFRRVSHADLPPSILWHNRQTEACLFLTPKTRNHHGDFEAQITKPELPVLRPKPGKPSPSWFRGSTKKPTTGFEAKPEKPSPSVLRLNWQKPPQQVLRPNR
jgi:hypothetical protein